MLGSRADTTVVKYGYAFQCGKAPADRRLGVAVFPISEVQFALYLQHLSETTGSVSAVHEAINASSWVNQVAGHGPISHSPLVAAMLAGLKRGLAKPKTRKEPVTVEMLSGQRRCARPPFKRHGRWRSETAKDGYVRDNSKALICVTGPCDGLCYWPVWRPVLLAHVVACVVSRSLEL